MFSSALIRYSEKTLVDLCNQRDLRGEYYGLA